VRAYRFSGILRLSRRAYLENHARVASIRPVRDVMKIARQFIGGNNAHAQPKHQSRPEGTVETKAERIERTVSVLPRYAPPAAKHSATGWRHQFRNQEIFRQETNVSTIGRARAQSGSRVAPPLAVSRFCGTDSHSTKLAIRSYLTFLYDQRFLLRKSSPQCSLLRNVS